MNKNWEPIPKDKILKNIESVFKNKNIELLNNTGYNCLYLMSGFIAHYNLQGFRDNYQDLRDLINDILNSMDTLYPDHSSQRCFIESYGERYCKSKTETYKGLRELALKYQNEIETHFTLSQSSEELSYAELLASKNGYKLVRQ